MHLGDLLVVHLGHDVQIAGLPPRLPLALLREQPLLRIAQARGPLEVRRVDRRLLLAPDARDLLVELTQIANWTGIPVFKLTEEES